MSNAPRIPGAPNIEITLFGLLVSLALKAAIDTAYGNTLAGAASPADLWRAVDVPASPLFLVFLATLVRFIFGAYRISDEVQSAPDVEGSGTRFWNLVAILVLFVLFYTTGLSIRHAEPFFLGLVAIHAWDLVWLFTMIFISRIEHLRGVMATFLALDAVTVVLLLGVLWLFPDQFRLKAVGLMLMLSVVDFAVSKDFFFNTAVWRNRAAAGSPP